MKKLLALTLLGLAFAAAGCDREGPAERAGEKIDNAVDQVQEQAQDAREKAEGLADDLRDKVDEAGGDGTQQ
jgi:hypothetical protein